MIFRSKGEYFKILVSRGIWTIFTFIPFYRYFVSSSKGKADMSNTLQIKCKVKWSPLVYEINDFMATIWNTK